MVAYFALLSFVPLVFLALALLASRTASTQLPSSSMSSRRVPGNLARQHHQLVHSQDNAAALGIIGGVGLLWSSLSLFSALESALNIVYGLPNRGFLRGKGIAAALMSSVIVDALREPRHRRTRLPSLRRPPGSRQRPLTYMVSVGAWLSVSYCSSSQSLAGCRTLRSLGEALPGAALGALARGVVPGGAVFVRFADINVTLRTLGGPAILLLSLYVMANVLIFGGEVNWWSRERRRAREEAPVPPLPGES